MIPEFDWWKMWAKYAPSAIGLKDASSGRELSYDELYRLAQQTALHLQTKFNVKKGDRVAVLVKNHWRYVVLYFATQRLGAILVPINFRLTASEVQHVIDDSQPKVFICGDDFTDLKKQLVHLPFSLSFEQGLSALMDAPTEMAHNFEEIKPEDPTMILYTSGTTGIPKGAIITYQMLFWNSMNTGLRLNLTQHDVQLAYLPFFHTGGWNVLLTPFMHRGAKTILLEKFDPTEILKLCETEKATIIFGVPTMMDMMARDPLFKTADLSSVRYAIVGGEPMPIPLIKKWQEKNIPIRQGYGLTEFGPNVFSLNEEDAIRKMGSIGFANFYIETKVVDEQGRALAAEAIGELLLKGPMCTTGYWNNPKATQEAIRDGWLHTGDLVRFDEEGYCYVVGRKKDMFISGAENVYPAEIEKVLREHPKVQDAAVVGVHDEKWGECGKAFLLVEPSVELVVDEIRGFLLQKLAKYKVPKHYRFVNALPKGDSGKILKRLLKDWD